MKLEPKKRAAVLGIRIGAVFLLAVFIIILIAYYILSQNFEKLLKDYTVKLVQSMTDQGVKMVEMELEMGRKEAALLAASLDTSGLQEEEPVFPQTVIEGQALRMVYVTQENTVSSDGRGTEIKSREDIVKAFDGETSIYGPYYNEENEFVICYTAPVKRDNAVIGVLSIERDGYRFCDLISSIKFVNSGECYIINAEGTDIAVSNREHIEWVTEQYNARMLLQEELDPETQSIMELEQKGLSGETGVGSYYWEDGLCYVVYQPIPSIGWVMLAGLREEEITAMTRSALFDAISKGPVLGFCLLVFFLVTVMIIFWIISSMKENAQINEKLEIIANHDTLTGLLNRRFLESSLSQLWNYPIKVPSSAAVYMLDIDNFKKYNDFYGHPKGDECLCRVSGVFKHVVDRCGGNVLRYGGEEFLAVVFQIDRQEAADLGKEICRLVEEEHIQDCGSGFVTVSVGVRYVDSTLESSLYENIRAADRALYQAKKNGKNRAVIYDEDMG